MLLFGHIGITLGTSALLANALSGSRFYKAAKTGIVGSSSPSRPVTPVGDEPLGYKASWFDSLGSLIDIRLLLIGTMLPDIIDKPIGIFFFGEALSNGRIFSHTLVFLILTTIAGLFLYRTRGRTCLLGISFGILTHFILDQMWSNPQTLFWPIFGLHFERIDVSNWMPNMWHSLFHKPATYIPELVGAVIIVWFAFTLWRRRKIFRFLKAGQIH